MNRRDVQLMDNSAWSKLYNTANFGLAGLSLVGLWLLPVPYNFIVWSILFFAQMTAIVVLLKWRYGKK